MTVPWTATVVLALSVLAPQEPLRFESRVDSVYVDAFVNHKGQPVLGLTAENFEVLDNGVRQEIRLVSLDLVPVAVFLVFDTSSSVAGPALGHLRAAGHAVLDQVRRALPGVARLRRLDRVDNDVLRAQKLDHPHLVGRGALADGEHTDHRGHTEDDAQRREQRPQLVQPQIRQPELEGFNAE